MIDALARQSNSILAKHGGGLKIQPVVIHFVGSPDIGKSTLMRHFNLALTKKYRREVKCTCVDEHPVSCPFNNLHDFGSYIYNTNPTSDYDEGLTNNCVVFNNDDAYQTADSPGNKKSDAHMLIRLKTPVVTLANMPDVEMKGKVVLAPHFVSYCTNMKKFNFPTIHDVKAVSRRVDFPYFVCPTKETSANGMSDILLRTLGTRDDKYKYVELHAWDFVAGAKMDQKECDRLGIPAMTTIPNLIKLIQKKREFFVRERDRTLNCQSYFDELMESDDESPEPSTPSIEEPPIDLPQDLDLSYSNFLWRKQFDQSRLPIENSFNDRPRRELCEAKPFVTEADFALLSPEQKEEYVPLDVWSKLNSNLLSVDEELVPQSEGFFSGAAAFVRRQFSRTLIEKTIDYFHPLEEQYDFKEEQIKNELKELYSRVLAKPVNTLRSAFPGICDFVKNNWKSILILLTAVSAVSKVCSHVFSESKWKYGTPPSEVPLSEEQKSSILNPVHVTAQANTSGEKDPMTQVVRNLYNMVFVKQDETSKWVPDGDVFGSCLAINQWTIVCPRHFAIPMKEKGKKIGILCHAKTISGLNPHTWVEKAFDLNDPKSAISEYFDYATDNTNNLATDLMAIVFTGAQGLNSCPDISSKFVSKDDYLTSLKSGQFTFHEKTLSAYHIDHIHPTMTGRTGIETANTDRLGNSLFVSSRDLSYTAVTKLGSCGSIILRQTPDNRIQVMGMHVGAQSALFGPKFCYGVSIYKEEIAAISDTMLPDKHKLTFGLPLVNVQPTPRPIEPENPQSEALIGAQLVDLPCDKRVLSRSKIRESAFKSALELYFEDTKAPAKLKAFKKDGVIIDPMAKATDKFRNNHYQYLEPDILEEAFDIVVEKSLKFSNKIDIAENRGLLTYEQAIRGIPDVEGIDALNLSASAGYPFSDMEGALGKKHIIGPHDGDINDCKYPGVLKQAVDEFLADCKRGHITPMPFIDRLKDEVRPIEKVESGSTRLFSMAPTTLLIVFRMYFGQISHHIMVNRIRNEMAIGVNQYTEWHYLYKYMTGNLSSPTFGDGDHSAFDTELLAEVLWLVFRYFEKYYPHASDEDRLVRHALAYHIIYAIHIGDVEVFQAIGSNPSGNAFTTIINCIANLIMCYYIYCKAYRLQNLRLKPEATKIRLCVLGDDNIHSRCATLRYHVSMEEFASIYEITFGKKFQAASKDGSAHTDKPVEEITFLKRYFRMDELTGLMVAPIEIDVLKQTLKYVKQGSSSDEYRLRIRMNMYELSLHTIEVFQEISKIFQDVFRIDNDLYQETCRSYRGAREILDLLL
uniref:Polyprotein n=1 Tax=Reticulitermes speratus picorna-like virus TaxID=3032236 RepID=A0AAT9JFE1_9VIRU